MIEQVKIKFNRLGNQTPTDISICLRLVYIEYHLWYRKCHCGIYDIFLVGYNAFCLLCHFKHNALCSCYVKKAQQGTEYRK